MVEVITYDALREIQYNERKSEKLYQLNDNFYESIKEYFGRNPKDELTELELRNAKNILKDILDRRERKILSQALVAVRSGLETNVKVMTTREQELLKSLVDILKKHREEVSKPMKGKKKRKLVGDDDEGPEEIPNQVPDDIIKPENPDVFPGEEKLTAKSQKLELETEPTTSYIKVKILQELPEMLGADFKSYGPFKEGEIIEIPEQNAEIFIEKGKAQQV